MEHPIDTPDDHDDGQGIENSQQPVGAPPHPQPVQPLHETASVVALAEKPCSPRDARMARPLARMTCRSHHASTRPGTDERSVRRTAATTTRAGGGAPMLA